MQATRQRSLGTGGTVLAVAIGTALVVALSSFAVTSLGGFGASRASSRISTTWSASAVKLGTPATVKGRVTSKRIQVRTVSLYVYLKSGWRRVGYTRTGPAGYYKLAVPTDYYYTRPLQVRARATSRAKAVYATAHSFSVRPAGTPGGASSAWARGSSTESRVNPCRTVTYRVNGATDAQLAEVRAAFTRAHEATGITFRYLGTTAAVPRPSATSTAPWPSDTTIVVAWTSPDRTTFELGGPPATAILSQSAVLGTQPAKDAQGPVQRITRAGVVLDAAADLTTGSELRHVLMHEVGVTLGLGPVTDTFQRMNEATYPRRGTVTWGAGDLVGLNRVGLVEGCLTHR
jgi:hypothetical protein